MWIVLNAGVNNVVVYILYIGMWLGGEMVRLLASSSTDSGCDLFLL